MNRGLVFWFTGLSGSGKTTIANGAADALLSQGKKIKMFDGDFIRSTINRHLTFAPEDIKENNRIIAELCLTNKDRFDYIFVPIISPFETSRKQAREIIGIGFYLIYIRAQIQEIIRRDTKGLYSKALKGEIDNFIGISEKTPFQRPQRADLILDAGSESPQISTAKFIRFVKQTEKTFYHTENQIMVKRQLILR